MAARLYRSPQDDLVSTELLSETDDFEAGAAAVNASKVRKLALGAAAVVGAIALAGTLASGPSRVAVVEGPRRSGGLGHVHGVIAADEQKPLKASSADPTPAPIEAAAADGETPAAVETPKCSVGLENCNVTKCCDGPGRQCYQQNAFYSQCRDTCTKGPDPTHWDGQPWSCQELGTRSRGSAKCSKPGENCKNTGCCTEVGTQCFEKDENWATCKSECIEDGPDMYDIDGKPWTCKKLGPWTPGASPWVAGTCANDYENCAAKGCCATAGFQCFKQNDFWAQCKASCIAGKDPQQPWAPEWSCETVGSKTPAPPVPTGGRIHDWVLETCAHHEEDCSKSKCCKGVDQTCYQKDKDWAMCMEDCTAGRHADDNNQTWSCKPLGPRSHGLALKGSPSLYCWSLIQTTTYEIDVIRYAMKNKAGIFGCDEFDICSTDNATLVGHYEGKPVTTLHAEPAPITTSLDGTAGNAKLFMNVWDVIIKTGRWRNHAWTLKVDPDAVMIASRVRSHMASHFGEKVYVVNCNKFPNSPNFPMMYGALEVYSFKAIDTYARNSGLCVTDMGMMLPMWGEDYYMTHCLDHIGVGRIADFGVLGDWNCLGNNCGDAYTASFHPFKTVESWANCLKATGEPAADPEK